MVLTKILKDLISKFAIKFFIAASEVLMNKEINPGKLIKLFRENNLLVPGLVFYTGYSDTQIPMYAKRAGIQLKTTRIFTLDMPNEKIGRLTRVEVIAISPSPKTGDLQPKQQ